MSSLKQLSRLVNGISLVAKEIASRSPAAAAAAAASGDFQALAKRALLSATDISGLTKGKVREFKSPDLTTTAAGGDREAESSVVYFDRAPPTDVAVEVQEERENEKEREGERGSESGNGVVSGSGRESAGNEGAADVAVPEEGEKREEVVEVRRRKPRERRVPSTPFSRAIGFAGLGAGLAWGTIQESAKRIMYGRSDLQGKQSALSPFLSEDNAERLALGLCRMRGAALKIGQMLSIQDESLVPAPVW